MRNKYLRKKVKKIKNGNSILIKELLDYINFMNTIKKFLNIVLIVVLILLK